MAILILMSELCYADHESYFHFQSLHNISSENKKPNKHFRSLLNVMA